MRRVVFAMAAVFGVSSTFMSCFPVSGGTGNGGTTSTGGTSNGGMMGNGGSASGGSASGGSASGGSANGGSASGGSASGGSASGGSANGGSANGGATTQCTSYCTTIQTKCNDVTHKQYANNDQCLATCATWPLGTMGEYSNNTKHCHLSHANASGTNDSTHCPHAGPTGGLSCGATLCDDFCDLVIAACATQVSPPYASRQACMTACGNFNTSPAYNSSVQSGNSFSCRMYHAVASAVDAAGHCGHVGPSSPPCM